MGLKWKCDKYKNIIVVSFGVLGLIAEVCSGGITSSYLRNDDLGRDMPLDSDVFRVPPGYNAPQQVLLPMPCPFLLLVHEHLAFLGPLFFFFFLFDSGKCGFWN